MMKTFVSTTILLILIINSLGEAGTYIKWGVAGLWAPVIRSVFSSGPPVSSIMFANVRD